jgi:hypothetical protein
VSRRRFRNDLDAIRKHAQEHTGQRAESPQVAVFLRASESAPVEVGASSLPQPEIVPSGRNVFGAKNAAPSSEKNLSRGL